MTRAALAAAGLLAGLLLAEGVCRLIPRYRLEAFAHRFGPGLQADERYRPDTLLGYVHEPNSGTSMGGRTNSLGLVNPEFPREKGPGVKRVLVLGDSILEMGFFTQELQRLLDARRDGVRWEVWNAAVAGYNVPQYVRVLESKGDAYAPDFVLVGFCLNDFAYDIPVFYRDPDGRVAVYAFFQEEDMRHSVVGDYGRLARSFLSPWLLRRSAFYRLALTAAHGRMWEGSPLPARYYKVGYQEVGRLKSWAESRRVPLAAVVFPYLVGPEQMTRLMRIEKETMPAVLKALEVPSLELGPFLPGDPARWRREPGDWIHPSPAGARLLAGRAYAFTEKLGWLKKTAAARPRT